MNGHVVGNLLIVGLWELMGEPVRALDWVGRLLGAHGRVLPMATTPMDITARVRGAEEADPEAVTVVRGQVEVATTGGPHRVRRPRPGGPAGLRGGRRRDPRRRVGRARSGVVVQLGDPAPDGARAPPCPRRDRRAARRGAQPRGAGGGDDRLRSRRPPRRAVRARTRPDGPRGARRRVRDRGRPRPGWRRTWPTAAPAWWSPTSPSRGSRATTPTGSRRRSGRSWTRPESRLRGWLDRSRRGSLTYVAGFAPWL